GIHLWLRLRGRGVLPGGIGHRPRAPRLPDESGGDRPRRMDAAARAGTDTEPGDRAEDGAGAGEVMRARALRSAAAAIGILAVLAVSGPGAAAEAGPVAASAVTASAPVVDAGQQCTPGQRLLTPAPSYLIKRLGLDQAWSLSRGAGVTVAIVDSGVDGGNVHLQGALVPGFTSFGD